MLGSLKAYARAGQAVITAPFILAGAMSPVSVAGTLAQTLAEAMSGIAFTQLSIRTPVVFGSFASPCRCRLARRPSDTGTGQGFMAGQLARRLGCLRSGGSLTAAKTADAQSAYESAHTILPTVLGGVNLFSAAGWMEGGLVSDYRKIILDADQRR